MPDSTHSLRVRCECEDEDALVYVVPMTETGPIEMPILMRRDGTVTNRYADGVVGVPKPLRELAEEDEEPYCSACDSHCTWEHQTA